MSKLMKCNKHNNSEIMIKFQTFIRVIITILVCNLYNIAFADHILLRNGKSLEVHNIEVSENYIFYNDINKDAPIKKLNRGEVYAVKIGDNDIVQLQNNSTHSIYNIPIKNDKTTAKISEDNERLKFQYTSSDYTSTKKEKKKAARSVILFYGLTDDSVISTEDIEVSFESGWFRERTWYNLNSEKRNNVWAFSTQVKIIITNKTDQPIYIDLTRSYRNGNLAGYRSFYDGTQTTSSTGSAYNIGFGIRPILLGSTEYNGNTLTKGQLPIITIPPKARINLPPYQVLTPNNEVYDRFDSFSSMNGKEIASSFSDLNVYGKKIFEEDSSPVNVYYSFTYSKHQDFKETNTFDFKFFAKQAIGIPPLVQYMSGVTGRDPLKEIRDIDNKTIIGSINIEEISPTSIKGSYYSKFEQLCLIWGSW